MKPLLFEPGSLSHSCTWAAIGQVCQECPLAAAWELRHVCEAAPMNCSAWMGGCPEPWNKVQGRFLFFFHFKADAGYVVCSEM